MKTFALLVLIAIATAAYCSTFESAQTPLAELAQNTPVVSSKSQVIKAKADHHATKKAAKKHVNKKNKPTKPAHKTKLEETSQVIKAKTDHHAAKKHIAKKSKPTKPAHKTKLEETKKVTTPVDKTKTDESPVEDKKDDIVADDDNSGSMETADDDGSETIQLLMKLIFGNKEEQESSMEELMMQIAMGGASDLLGEAQLKNLSEEEIVPAIHLGLKLVQKLEKREKQPIMAQSKSSDFMEILLKAMEIWEQIENAINGDSDDSGSEKKDAVDTIKKDAVDTTKLSQTDPDVTSAVSGLSFAAQKFLADKMKSLAMSKVDMLELLQTIQALLPEDLFEETTKKLEQKPEGNLLENLGGISLANIGMAALEGKASKLAQQIKEQSEAKEQSISDFLPLIMAALKLFGEVDSTTAIASSLFEAQAEQFGKQFKEFPQSKNVFIPLLNSAIKAITNLMLAMDTEDVTKQLAKKEFSQAKAYVNQIKAISQTMKPAFAEVIKLVSQKGEMTQTVIDLIKKIFGSISGFVDGKKDKAATPAPKEEKKEEPKSTPPADSKPEESKKAVKPKALAELESSLSQVKTQATFLNGLAQSLQHIEKFNSSIKSHKDVKTVKSLAEAFKTAGDLAESLSKSHQQYAAALPKGSDKAQTQLAQSDSMEGIIGILKKAYKLIGDIK